MVGLLAVSCIGGEQFGSNNLGWAPISVAISSESDGTPIVYAGVRMAGDLKALGAEDDENRVKVQAIRAGESAASVQWYYPRLGTGEGIEGVFGPPVVNNDLDMLFVSAVDGRVYALRLSDGTSVEGWPKTVGEGLPLIAGPTLAKLDSTDVLIVASEDQRLYAYDVGTGERLWEPFVTEGKIWSTPVVAGESIFFGSHDRHIYAVDLRTGKQKWSFAAAGAVVAPPLVFKDLVIVGSFDRNLYALNASNGSLAWKFQAGNWFWSAAIADANTIYAAGMDGNVYALDASGKVVWQHDMETAIVSRPALVPRGLVVAAVDGRMKLLKTTPPIRTDGDVLDPLPQVEEEIKSPLAALIISPQPDGTGILEASVFVNTEDAKLRKLILTEGRNLEARWCFDARRQEIADRTTCKARE